MLVFFFNAIHFFSPYKAYKFHLRRSIKNYICILKYCILKTECITGECNSCISKCCILKIECNVLECKKNYIFDLINFFNFFYEIAIKNKFVQAKTNN